MLTWNVCALAAAQHRASAAATVNSCCARDDSWWLAVAVGRHHSPYHALRRAWRRRRRTSTLQAFPSKRTISGAPRVAVADPRRLGAHVHQSAALTLATIREAREVELLEASAPHPSAHRRGPRIGPCVPRPNRRRKRCADCRAGCAARVVPRVSKKSSSWSVATKATTATWGQSERNAGLHGECVAAGTPGARRGSSAAAHGPRRHGRAPAQTGFSRGTLHAASATAAARSRRYSAAASRVHRVLHRAARRSTPPPHRRRDAELIEGRRAQRVRKPSSSSDEQVSW